ncbi:CPBP family intramembrane glutamic endopeptidase [uncultured Tenacibaculum sp.]|uniref:CPBP family intramembrane glutamic endopeptidase n=1 Tax=uncultured Tenacibaculum sp. TaxID=174713 RepID=UPI00260D5481|nr:CPBP family intramembrane glutamic endopeptidase [uncultured Tenacibaculum sp.]
MKIPKAILHTFLFIFFLEFIGLWILLIPDVMKNINLIKASQLINSIVFLVFIFKNLKKSYLLKLDKSDPKYYFIALTLGVGFVFFQSILNIFYHQEISSEFFDFKFTLERLRSLSVMASIFVIPITEELFFRNYILRELLENYKPTTAIILSSLMFAFIHIPFVSLFYEFYDFSIHQAYIAVFGGLVSGILFYKSKSIIPSIIFHAFWNLTSYII